MKNIIFDFSSLFHEPPAAADHSLKITALDYLIDSHIKRACVRSIQLESDFAFCACFRFRLSATSTTSKDS